MLSSSSRLVLGHVEHLDLHLHVGVDLAAQVAVDQLQPAVGQLIRQQAAGEAPSWYSTHKASRCPHGCRR
jgi:hypothetical protein